MLSEFSSARSHICLEFYIIRNDRSGDLFADALQRAAQRGVSVFLIYDYIGCIDTPASFFRGLEEGGVRCLPFNRPPFKRGLRWFDRRNHRKFAVIDGTCAFMGGMNIGDEYAGYGDSVSRWRDLGIRLEGSAAAEMQRLFLETWGDEDGKPPPALPSPPPPVAHEGAADIMVVSGGPHHSRSFIRSSFRLAIAGASESVRIITPYFIPGPFFVRSLLRAAKRGVRVQLLLPAVSDVPLAQIAGKVYLTQLLKSGIEIYKREGTVLHAKLMLIDDCWTTLGSANLDMRSFHRNFEINVIIDSHDFGYMAAELFAEELAKSRRVTLQEHEASTWFEKLLERLCDPIRRFL
jgi:cardiolipin synthase